MPPDGRRYLRTGTEVPQIYPYQLRYLTVAVRDTEQASARLPGQHVLFLVRDARDWQPLQVYESGQLTWQYTREE
jgi:hypothetical protein